MDVYFLLYGAIGGANSGGAVFACGVQVGAGEKERDTGKRETAE